MNRLLIFIAFVFSFSGCNTSEDCEDCRAAIEHMFAKINGQGCNPNFMQEAWQRIKDECGNDADNQVGYMAETCYNGQKQMAGCKIDPGVSEMKFNMSYVSGPTNDTVVLIINRRDGLEQRDVEIAVNQSFQKIIDIPIKGGTYLQFRLQSKDTVTTFIDTEQLYSFDRPGYWDQVRTVQVNHTVANGYSLTFDFW
jgi:hypothetical protein